MISWLADLWRTWRNQPFEWDLDFPDSDNWTDRTPWTAIAQIHSQHHPEV